MHAEMSSHPVWQLEYHLYRRTLSKEELERFWADPSNWSVVYYCPEDPRVIVPKTAAIHRLDHQLRPCLCNSSSAAGIIDSGFASGVTHSISSSVPMVRRSNGGLHIFTGPCLPLGGNALS